MEILNEICEILDTYSGRDKIVRTLCYSTKLISGLTTDSNNVSERFNKFSKQMSSTRAVLRLLDDIPMLKNSLEYGLGKQEPDRYMATLGVGTNIIDQLYYPIEKVAWLAEHDLVSVQNPEAWDIASSVCWVASIYLSLMRSLRYISILQSHKACMQNAEKLGGELTDLTTRQKLEVLASIRYAIDLVHAVNTLPAGCLWAGTLKPWHVGLIGTISSLLGIYQLLWKKSIAKNRK